MGGNSCFRQRVQTNFEFFKHYYGGDLVAVSQALGQEVYVAFKYNGGVTGGTISEARWLGRSEYYWRDPWCENSGIYGTRCPEKILKILTPPEQMYEGEGLGRAIEWRAKCWENIAARKALKFTVGDIVRIPDSVKFTDGQASRYFRITSLRPFRMKYPLSSYNYYRINNDIRFRLQVITDFSELTEIDKMWLGLQYDKVLAEQELAPFI